MKLVTKLVAASILALSAITPALANEENILIERNAYLFTSDARPIAQHQQVAGARKHGGVDALAFQPAHVAPQEVRDYAVGNQQ